MRNSRLIIAVVGPSSDIETIDPGGDIGRLARAVGREITDLQHVLLTGGAPNPSVPAPIKDAAMEGAWEAGAVDRPARLISVLPREPDIDIEYSFSAGWKHLIVRTSLRDARNFVNGWVPDAVIAIHGGAGTLSEVAIAHALGTPVVFLQLPEVLDTLRALRSAPIEPSPPRTCLNEILEVAHRAFPFFDVRRVADEIVRYINQDQLECAGSASAALEKAVTLCERRLIGSSNGIPYHKGFAGKFDLYEAALGSLVD